MSKIKFASLIVINALSVVLLSFSVYFSWVLFGDQVVDLSGQVLGRQEDKVVESESSSSSSSQKPESIELSWPEPEAYNFRTAVFGDVFWGRRIAKWSEASELKTAYPFSGLNTFDRQKYNAWIANLVCPVTDQVLTDYQQETLLQFNCSPEYLSEAKKYFDVFSLSNNHTDNMEEFNGLEVTRQKLEENNIDYFGHFDNAVTGDVCEIISFEVDPVFSETQKSEVVKMRNLFETQQNLSANELLEQTEVVKTAESEYFLPMAFCGFHNVFKLPTEAEMAEISKYSEKFITIVMPHQGAEYGSRSDSLQRQYFRRMADLGGDIIIGNHTHSVHETENYNGKLIVYSLGNFIFDQQYNSTVTQGIGIDLNFKIPAQSLNQDWLKLANTCQEFKDDCLENAKAQNLEKIKTGVEFGLLGSDNSGQLTKKASDGIYQNLLIRTDWKNTVAGLDKEI